MKLVVTEKPPVAQAVSAVLGARERKDGYLVGNDYIFRGVWDIWCSLPPTATMKNTANGVKFPIDGR